VITHVCRLDRSLVCYDCIDFLKNYSLIFMKFGKDAVTINYQKVIEVKVQGQTKNLPLVVDVFTKSGNPSMILLSNFGTKYDSRRH